jgi:TetR/AcrR family transcriptional repressor of nem operon
VAARSDARDRLVQAAIDLIWNASYGAVSVDAICERAEVRKGSFYHFFASKDDLVVAALEAHWNTRRPLLDEIFSAARPPLERLRRYFAYVVERQTEVRGQRDRCQGAVGDPLAAALSRERAARCPGGGRHPAR